MLMTLLAFAFAIAVLVFVHEYGHYWVAKRCGVGVLTFSIGFGKPLLQWQRGETTWQIALIPLGGFVRMMDETEAPLAGADVHKAFNRQHPLKKMAVVFAGPLANLLFAILVFGFCYWQGVETLKPQVASVAPNSIAQQAGLRVGDQVVMVGTQEIVSWDQLQIALFDYAGQSGATLQLRSADGATRALILPLNKLSAEQYDQQLLTRIGLSPFSSARIVAFVQPKSAAEQAGIQVGDEIIAINELPVRDWSDLQRLTLQYGQQPLTLLIKRQAQMLTRIVKPHLEQTNGQSIPRLGLAPEPDVNKNKAQALLLQLPPWQALQMGVEKTYQLSLMTLRMFGKMLTGALSPKQVSGPLGIAEYAGQSAQHGWKVYLQFLALMSISLGVLNLLPVPILDGGHLLYHSYELVAGKTVPLLVTEWLQKVGLFLLLMLMALALFNDTSRLLLG